KIDRRALPDPELSAPAEQFVAPASELEEQLAEIWGQVLGVARLGTADNFFSLGGHSLLAAQVIARVRAELGTELPLRTLFEAPTVAQLAGRIEATQGVAAPPSIRPLPPESE